MTEINLADYTGFVLTELVRSREQADLYSLAVARRYAAHPELRYFPAPRFRIPKLDVTIPVLIADARFSQVLRFAFAPRDFVTVVGARAADVRMEVELARSGDPDRPISTVPSPAVERLAVDFHRELAGASDLRQPDTVVGVWWARIFWTALREAALDEFYRSHDPALHLLRRSTDDVLRAIRARIVVDRTTIDSLLVEPVTSAVKNGTTEASAFAVRAELLEECILLRTVTDEQTGQSHPVVEFE